MTRSRTKTSTEADDLSSVPRHRAAGVSDGPLVLSAVVGAVLALLLTPIQSAVWNGQAAPPLVRALGPLHDLAGRLAHGIQADANLYYVYGRLFVLVYLGALGGLVVLQRLSHGVAHLSRTWVRVLTVTVAAATVLDVLAYSGISGNLAFHVEMAAIAVALVVATLHGRQFLRTPALPRWAGWALIASLPAAVLCVALTQYLPHAAVLPLSLALAAVAVGTRPHGRRS